MNNLERWIYSLPFSDIESYEQLIEKVYNHSERDYLFFPFLIGYVKQFLKKDEITEDVRNNVFQLLYDLSTIKKVKIFFVNEKNMIEAEWSSIEELKDIIRKIEEKWKTLDYQMPEINEVIWLTN
jgi:hypothetical protein